MTPINGGSSHEENVVILSATDHKQPPHSVFEILSRHEARINYIEHGLHDLDEQTKKTNHHLANMRQALKSLKPINDSIDSIKDSVEKNKEELLKQQMEQSKHQVKVETDFKHIVKAVGGIGSWIKWGVGTMISSVTIFLTAATLIKIFG